MEDEYTIPFGKNTYCGPAALAYILRSDPDTAASQLRMVSKRKAIKGTHVKHMLAALDQHGIKYIPMFPVEIDRRKRGKHARLGKWMASQPTAAEFLVNVTGHYVVVHRGMVWDSHKHLGAPVHKTKFANSWIRNAWWIPRE